jgi:hypothetical protein
MDEAQLDCDVTIEISDELGTTCYSAELRLAGEEHDGGLDSGHPIIYAHVTDEEHERITDVQHISEQIGLSVENVNKSPGLFEPEVIVNAPISELELESYNQYELILKGYDSSTDATDHLVKWISCPNEKLLRAWLVAQKVDSAVESIALMQNTNYIHFGEGLDVAIATLNRYSIYQKIDGPANWKNDSKDAMRVSILKKGKVKKKKKSKDASITSSNTAKKTCVVKQLVSVAIEKEVESLLNDDWKIEALSHPTIILSKLLPTK